eukprot:511027-Pelagomonas_calceolata.AAC.1
MLACFQLWRLLQKDKICKVLGKAPGRATTSAQHASVSRAAVLNCSCAASEPVQSGGQSMDVKQ